MPEFIKIHAVCSSYTPIEISFLGKAIFLFLWDKIQQYLEQ